MSYLRAVDRVFTYHPKVLPMPGALPDVGELLLRLRAHTARVALDSAAGTPRRWSWVAFDPLEELRDYLELDELRALSSRVEFDSSGDSIPGPFAGGFLGALSYELGVYGESRAGQDTDPWDSPRVLGALYVDFFVLDHEKDEWWLVLSKNPGDGRPSVAVRREQLELELAAALPVDEEQGEELQLIRHVSVEEHCRRIEAARESIAAGEYYQANLAHRFSAGTERRADDLYVSLRRENPAPYMAFLEWGERALLSASPELLLEYDGEQARTRPIKGTARRSADPLEDAQIARRLLASEKDRAELAMIVDLERNDFGRIAQIGTVRVGELPRLESFASVHHLLADVECNVLPELDAVDVLQAIFPGGSITGAPKLAAMRGIAELEQEGRGFFTGSAGYLDFFGRARFNILIRTLVWRPGEVSFHVGGGITWSSSPTDEDRETLVKAERLVSALGGSLAEEIEA